MVDFSQYNILNKYREQIRKQDVQEAIQQATINQLSNRREAQKAANQMLQKRKDTVRRAPTSHELEMMEISQQRQNLYNDGYRPSSDGIWYKEVPISEINSGENSQEFGLGYIGRPTDNEKSGQEFGLGYTPRPVDVEPEYTYEYSVFDESGRKHTLSEDQYNDLIRAQKEHASKYQTFLVIPDEVANSGNNWRINADGMYEWKPTTESDIANLNKINAVRKTPRETLITGGVWTPEFTEEWLTTGGGSRGYGAEKVKLKNSKGEVIQTYDYNTAILAPIGSGDLKIKEINEKSSINSNASAKTKDSVSIISTIEKEALAAEADILNPLKKTHSGRTQEESDLLYAQKLKGEYNPKAMEVKTLDNAGINKDTKIIHGDIVNFNKKAEIDAAKASREAGRAAEAAYKPIIGNDGFTKISPIEVDKGSLDSTAGILGIRSGEGYYSRNKAVSEFREDKALKHQDWKNRQDLIKGEVNWIKPATENDTKGLGIVSEFKSVNQMKNEQIDADLKEFAGDSKIKKAIGDVYKSTYSKENIDTTINKIDKKASEYLPTVQEIGNTRQEMISKSFSPEAAKNYEKWMKEKKEENKAIGFASDFSIGGYESFHDKPVSKAGEAIITGYLLGGATKGVTILSRVGLESVGLKTLSHVVEPAAVIGTTGLLGSEAVKTYNEYGAGGLGALAVDLGFGGIGYSKGYKHVNSAWDTYNINIKKGATELPTDNIISNEILSGKETLPLTKQGQTAESVIQDFKTPEGTYKGWHASDVLVKDMKVRGIDDAGNIVKSRPADNIGLYVSGEQKGLSPHFLRVSKINTFESINPASGIVSSVASSTKIAAGTGGKLVGHTVKLVGEVTGSKPTVLKGSKLVSESNKLLNTGLENLNSPLHPNAMHIEITGGVKRLPENIRGNANLADEFLANGAQKGSAYLTTKLERNIESGRAEHEAVIVPNSKLEVVSENKYFKFNDRKILIRELKTVSEHTPETRNKIIKAKDLTDIEYGKNKYSKGSYVPVNNKYFKYDQFNYNPVTGYNPINYKQPYYRDSNYKPSGYNPINYNPINYNPSNYKPSEYKPSEYKPSEYKPSEYNPIGYNESNYKPSDYTPSNYKPSNYNPSNYNPLTGYKSSNYKPSGYEQNYKASRYLPQDDTPIKTILPDLKRQTNTNPITSNMKYGKRQKHHYVKDPIEFVLGRGK